MECGTVIIHRRDKKLPHYPPPPRHHGVQIQKRMGWGQVGYDGRLGEFWVGVVVTHTHASRVTWQTLSLDLTHAHVHTLGWGCKPACTQARKHRAELWEWGWLGMRGENDSAPWAELMWNTGRDTGGLVKGGGQAGVRSERWWVQAYLSSAAYPLLIASAQPNSAENFRE